MAATIALPTQVTRTARDRVLITPEGVALPITLASRGSRVGALMLDFLILGTAFVLVTIALVSLAGGLVRFTSRVESGTAPAVMQFLVVVWIIMTFLVRYAWFLWFELGARGATPGKRLVGIRIAARDGGRLTAEMVIARNLLRDHHRVARRGAHVELDEAMVCPLPAADRVVAFRRAVALMAGALERMPPLRREIFLRRRLDGLTTAAIADRLDMSTAAVEKHVVRAFADLRTALARRGFTMEAGA